MERKKNIFLKIWVPIIVVFVTISILCLWTWYCFTMPDISEQFKFSPFDNSGVWICEDYNFTVSSSLVGSGQYYENGEEIYDRVVKGVLQKEETTYDFSFSYFSTRGFNHKYAAVIHLNAEGSSVGNSSYTCYYDFKENEFFLKEFVFHSGDRVFEGVKELKFIKQS